MLMLELVVVAQIPSKKNDARPSRIYRLMCKGLFSIYVKDIRQQILFLQ